MNRTLLARLALALPMLLALPTRVWASGENVKSYDFLDWDCAWSLWKWLLMIALAFCAWMLAFHAWFPAQLAQRSKGAVSWPMDSFGNSLVAFVMGFVLSFLFIFAVISNELTSHPIPIVPGGNSFFNRNFLWFAIFLAGCILAVFLRLFLFRHRSR